MYYRAAVLQSRDHRERSLPLRPITFARLHHQPFCPGRQLNRPPLRNSNRLVRHITNAVLAPQFILNGVEYLIDAMLLRNLKKTRASISRNPPECARAVRTAERQESVRARIGEQNGINERVRPLRGFN